MDQNSQKQWNFPLKIAMKIQCEDLILSLVSINLQKVQTEPEPMQNGKVIYPWGS